MSDTPIPPPPGNPPPPSQPPAAMPPPPAAGPSGTGAGGTESPNRSIMLVLSYLWLLALIPFLIEKDDKEVQWHAKHGLVLLAAEFVVWIGVFMVAYFVDCVGCILNVVVWLGILALHGYCIYEAVNGRRFKIQGLSDFADRF